MELRLEKPLQGDDVEDLGETGVLGRPSVDVADRELLDNVKGRGPCLQRSATPAAPRASRSGNLRTV